MNNRPAPDGVCQTSRLLPFPPADVFAAFANPERLAAWWGPDGLRNTFDVFQCTLTVTLQDAGNGTELHGHQAFDTPQLAAGVAHTIVPANEQNLDRLQALPATATG